MSELHDLTENIGKRIKELRKGQHVSQQTFAFNLGMSRSFLSGVECGKRNISTNTLSKIAHGLGVSLSEFFDAPDFGHPSTPDADC